MKRSMLGILAISLATSACSGGDGMPQASAAEPLKTASAEPAVAPVAPVEAPPPSARASAAAAPRRATNPVSRASAPRTASAAPATSAAPAPRAIPEYREFRVPAGTELALELKSAVSSNESQIEDTVRATLRRAIVIDGHEVLPAGTELAGSVIEAERAGRVKGRSRVAFQFTSLRYDGERYNLNTEPIAREGEATKGEDAKKIGIGAGAGAAIGALMGGGSGAAKGAAIGGAAGSGVVLATRGKDVRLEPGEDVPTRLVSPLAVRVRIGS